jgi:hypothetical protein
MLEIIILCIVFWLGYQLGLFIMSYRLRDLIYQEAKRRGLTKGSDDDLFEEPAVPTVSQLIVEKANNILYLYERDTDNFICQGSTLEELATLAEKYKNIKYAAVMQDDKIWAFVDGAVKSEKEVLKR